MKRLDGFARGRIRNADHGAFLDAWKAGKDFFDFVGIDIEAGDEDHVLAPVHDGEIALGIHCRDVAGPEPSIAQDIRRFRPAASNSPA